MTPHETKIQDANVRRFAAGCEARFARNALAAGDLDNFRIHNAEKRRSNRAADRIIRDLVA